MESRPSYLAVLISATHADGVITPEELDRIAGIGKEIFSHLGYGGDEDVAGVVPTLAARPAPVADVAGYVGAPTFEILEAIKFDVGKVIYCDEDPSQANRAWLELCMRHLGPAEWPLPEFFDLASTPGGRSRRDWLAEGAGVGEIRAAYRARARDCHPDKLAGVPPPIRALAEVKLAAINEAYHKLTGAAPVHGISLHFREPGERSRSRLPLGPNSYAYADPAGRSTASRLARARRRAGADRVLPSWGSLPTRPRRDADALGTRSASEGGPPTRPHAGRLMAKEKGPPRRSRGFRGRSSRPRTDPGGSIRGRDGPGQRLRPFTRMSPRGRRTRRLRPARRGRRPSCRSPRPAARRRGGSR